MKKYLYLVLPVLCLITLSITLATRMPKKSFELESKYYGKQAMTEITSEELSNLQDKKESFAVFVYQPMCSNSSNFEDVLTKFINEYNLTIYKISFSSIKDTKLGKKIKYYPSFVLFNEGKVVDYLDASKDEDTKYFTNYDSLKTWFTKYITIKEVTNENNRDENHEDTKVDILENVELEGVTKEKNKVNIYFFHGDGCPHCKEEFAFFDSIEKEYGKYYNLHTFEVWHNEYNSKLLKTFAYYLDKKVTGVPFTIIGEKVIVGFGANAKEEIPKAIKSEYKKDYDIYFDKIKNK